MKRFLGIICIFFFAASASAENALFLNRGISRSSETKRIAPQDKLNFEDSFETVLESAELNLLDSNDDTYEQDIRRSKYLLERGVLGEEDEQRLGKRLFMLNSKELVETTIKGGPLDDIYRGVKKSFAGIKKYTSLSLVEKHDGSIDTKAAYSENDSEDLKTHFKIHLEPTIRDGVKVSAETFEFLKLDIFPTKQRAVVRVDFDF